MLIRLTLTGTLVACTLWAAPALAEIKLIAGADTAGYYVDPDGIVTNSVFGTGGPLPDGSVIGRVGCVGPTPGSVGCVMPPISPPITEWWQRELPTTAAAQAATAFGTNRARAINVSGSRGDIEPVPGPGTRFYSAAGTSSWQDEWLYLGTTPTVITLEFHVHVAWNNRGRFSLDVGRPIYDPDTVPTIDHIYTNCVPPKTGCGGGIGGSGFFTTRPEGIHYAMGSGEENGEGLIDELVRFDLLLDPFIPDDEDPGAGPRPFDMLVSLMTYANLGDAETDAFSTVTLERILVDRGVQLSFASGTPFVVVERGAAAVAAPGTPLLGLAGFGAMAMLRRRTQAGARHRR